MANNSHGEELMVYTLPNSSNSGDPIQLVSFVSQQVPGLPEGILLLIFFTIMGFGYFAQQRKNGKGNLPQMMAVSCLIVTTLAYILFLYPNIVGLNTVVLCTIITFISVLWLMFTGRDSNSL